MARDKATQVNINNSEPAKYPNGRIKDNTGAGDGTPVNESVYGDHHEFFAKLMRLAGIVYNGLPDNEQDGYQLIQALEAFAGKNDFVYPLTGANETYSVPFKIGILKENETILLESLIDKGDQTKIRGADNIEKTVNVIGDFKSSEFVRLINTGSSIKLVRQVDFLNLSDSGDESGFLKKATQAEEDSGTIDTAATTPLVNKTTFTKRVNGNQSGNYLARQDRNGLMSKEDKEKLDNLGSGSIRNKGFFSNLDVFGSPGSLPTGGNIQSAVLANSDGSQITCRMANAMDDTNYLVKIYLESQGQPGFDNNLLAPTFRILSTTEFIVNVDEVANVQSIKVHLEVEQL